MSSVLTLPVSCVAASVFEDLRQRFTMFNGGFSKDQLDWLESVLTLADEKQEKVTIVSKYDYIMQIYVIC